MPAGARAGGLEDLLDWLEAQDGGSWQQRWLASGADAAGSGVAGSCPARLAAAAAPGMRAGLRRAVAALITAVCADIVRPSLAWLVAAGMRRGAGPRHGRVPRPAGLRAAAELCDHGPAAPSPKTARNHTLRRAAVILAAKGGMLADITVGDLLELLDTEADVLGAARAGAAACYRLLRQLATFGPAAPTRLRELRTAGQRTPGR